MVKFDGEIQQRSPYNSCLDVIAGTTSAEDGSAEDPVG
jgi:hypothetical protein